VRRIACLWLAAACWSSSKPAAPANPAPTAQPTSIELEQAELAIARAEMEAQVSKEVGGDGTATELPPTSGSLKDPPIAGLEIGVPIVGAGLDAAVVRRYLRRDEAALRACYEKHLRFEPWTNLQGTVSAVLTISASGLVTTARAKGLTTEIDACLVRTLEGLELPRPTTARPAEVTVPLELTFSR